VDVVVSSLTKRFTLKGSPAVFAAAFTAPSGGITTLLGPSGSGKTTVLRCIAGLEPVTEGQIFFGTDEVTHLPARKREVGFVFQAFALFDQMTVRKNISFGLEIRGMPEEQVQVRVDELLRLVQLEKLGARYPGELSGGERQRVGFARALAPRPRILLLDEPFGTLDPRVRVELRAWVRELHRETHLTTLLVTHDQEEALEMSDQIVVMHEGRVHQVGSPQQVYNSPQTPFVASFVGNANVLEGRVSGGRATLGSLSVAAPEGMPDGAMVRAIVRPHDVKIAKAVPGSSVSLATVARIANLGASVKLSLALHGGDTMNVELPRADLEAMGILAGDHVKIDLEQAKIFLDDYTI
jgi:sulfate/thiosulfate transport system ATP-binding protein